jgi:hypothetical protein
LEIWVNSYLHYVNYINVYQGARFKQGLKGARECSR